MTSDGAPSSARARGTGVLYGAEGVRNDPASKDDFRAILADIPSESLLYRMYGKTSPTADKLYIGSVTLESGFVASEFGDRILAFQHAMPTPRS